MSQAQWFQAKLVTHWQLAVELYLSISHSLCTELSPKSKRTLSGKAKLPILSFFFFQNGKTWIKINKHKVYRFPWLPLLCQFSLFLDQKGNQSTVKTCYGNWNTDVLWRTQIFTKTNPSQKWCYLKKKKFSSEMSINLKYENIILLIWRINI